MRKNETLTCVRVRMPMLTRNREEGTKMFQSIGRKASTGSTGASKVPKVPPGPSLNIRTSAGTGVFIGNTNGNVWTMSSDPIPLWPMEATMSSNCSVCPRSRR